MPSDNQHIPETPLMAVRVAWRQHTACKGSVHEVERKPAVHTLRQPYGKRLQRPRMSGSGELQQADFRRPECEGHVGGEAGVVALAGVRVEACGEVERGEQWPLCMRFHLRH